MPPTRPPHLAPCASLVWTPASPPPPLLPFPSHTSSSMSLGGNFFLAFGRQSGPGHMLPFPIGANLTHTQKKLFKSKKSLGKTHGWCKEDEEDWDQETLRLCQYVTVTVTAKPPLQSLVPCWVRTLKFWCTLLTPLHRPSQIWSHSSFLQKREIDEQHQQGLWKSTWAGLSLVAWFSGKWATFKLCLL